MKTILAITKALSDETRLRALVLLREGELCVCQIIDVLDLAPSTISRHMAILRDAGLVMQRKQGRWHYYRMAGREASPDVRAVLRWVLDGVDGAELVRADAARLAGVQSKDLKEVCECYRS